MLKRSCADEVRNEWLLVAMACRRGLRESGHLRRRQGGRKGWSGLLGHLKQRGLAGVELIVSDACLGLVESAAEHFPEARWQRCVVHWYRNVFSHVPSEKVREVAAMLKAIHAQEDRTAAEAKPGRN